MLLVKFVSPMNSAWVHCSWENWSTIAAETRKKKCRARAKNVDMDVYPNGYLI